MRLRLAWAAGFALIATTTPLGAQDQRLFTPDFPPAEFAARRMAVARAIGPGNVAVLQGAPSPPGYTRLRQSNDFYYLSGIETPRAYLLIEGGTGRNTLYVPHRNPARERGEGKMLSAEDGDVISELAGIDDVYGPELLGEHLGRMDYAPNVGYYNADVTRMWPVNGRWSAGQRELYGFYLACYEAILEPIRPGVLATVVKQEALANMERSLAAWRFSKPAYERAARQFVADYARSAAASGSGLGHWVGMATHDDGPGGGALQAGMVFTIEPALRVPEEQIYIRLEDMILVTPTGAEIMSDFVPRGLEAIERLMREDGMLQRYPRATSAVP